MCGTPPASEHIDQWKRKYRSIACKTFIYKPALKSVQAIFSKKSGCSERLGLFVVSLLHRSCLLF